MIRNVVMVRLKPGQDAREVAALHEDFRTLDLPGVVGSTIGSDLGLRDGNWSFAIVVDVADERAALDTDRPLRAALLFWANIDGASPTQLDAAMERMALTALAREAAVALGLTHRDGRPMKVLLESLFDQAKAGNAARFSRSGERPFTG